MNEITLFVSGLWPTSDGNGFLPLMAKYRKAPWFDPETMDTRYCKYMDDLFSIVKGYARITLVGHSFGGAAIVDLCEQLKEAGVKAIISVLLLEPVPFMWWVFGAFKLPDNVLFGDALCIKKSFGLPPSCGLVDHRYRTVTVNTWEHKNFLAIPEVLSEVQSFLEMS